MSIRIFSIIVTLLSVAYGVIIFVWFSESRFAGVTSIYLGAVLAAIPYVLESRIKLALDSARVAQFLQDTRPSSGTDHVAADRLRTITVELDGIRHRDIPLHQDLVDEYARQRLHDACLIFPKSRYLAIHIVNSVQRAEVWARDPSHDSWVYQYVAEQKAILKNGGMVERIFLFGISWLDGDANKELACRMLDRHKELFEDQATLASYADARSDEEDFAILNSREVFVWRVHPGPDLPRRSGRYVTDPSKVEDFVRRFDTLRVAAKTISEFRSKLDSSERPKAQTL